MVGTVRNFALFTAAIATLLMAGSNFDAGRTWSAAACALAATIALTALILVRRL